MERTIVIFAGLIILQFNVHIRRGLGGTSLTVLRPPGLGVALHLVSKNPGFS